MKRLLQTYHATIAEHSLRLCNLYLYAGPRLELRHDDGGGHLGDSLMVTTFSDTVHSGLQIGGGNDVVQMK